MGHCRCFVTIFRSPPPPPSDLIIAFWLYIKPKPKNKANLKRETEHNLSCTFSSFIYAFGAKLVMFSNEWCDATKKKKKKACLSPLTWSHSRRHGGKCPEVWQVVSIATPALAVVKLSTFHFFSIRYVCSRTLFIHYSVPNICRSLWRPHFLNFYSEVLKYRCISLLFPIEHRSHTFFF